MRPLLALICALFILAQPSSALDGRQVLGFGHIFNNDAIGDGRDRWRTGSYAVSWVRARRWDGSLPERFGELLEYRLRTEIIAPSNLVRPAAGDRRYAGVVSFGVHSHFRNERTEFSVGFDAVATGPMTGISGFQTAAHRAMGMPIPTVVLNSQIPNAVHPTLGFAAARTIPLGNRAVLRPFFEAQAGVETYLRFGADLELGRVFGGDLALRDVVTGHRFAAIRGDGPSGFGAVLGGDLAWVSSSAYLPAGGAARLQQSRTRLRAGVMWRGRKTSVFYGMTWLGREFTGQRASGQILGSLSLKVRF